LKFNWNLEFGIWNFSSLLNTGGVMKEIKGNYSGKGKKFCIVISRFNDFIGKELLAGALDTLTKSGVSPSDITAVWAPGSFEIPQILAKLNVSKFDAAIALGVVIRGDTPHFDFIASEITKGIARVSLDKKFPIVFGVITADSIEQAIERAGTKQGNKGRDAALSALEMVSIYSQV